MNKPNMIVREVRETELLSASSADRPGTGFTAAVNQLGDLPRKRQKRAVIAATLYVTDFLALVTAFIAASILRLGEIHTGQLADILFTILPLYFGFALNNNAHNASVTRDLFRSARLACSAFIFAAATLLLIAFFMKIGAEFSRLLFAGGTVFGLFLLVLSRFGVARFARGYLGDNPYANLCIYDRVPHRINRGVGAVEARSCGISPNSTDPETINRLGELASSMDRVIVHCRPQDRQSWAFMLRSLDVPIEIVTPELTALAPLAIHRRSGEASLQLGDGTLGWNQKFVKRAFDLALTVPSLPIVLPLMALIAIAIKLDSRGPVFFRQNRIGLGNRPFTIYKFRSMRVEASDAHGHKSTAREDDRITRVGRFIRTTSLDELPQVLNVLSGRMSIVGPRPHAEGSRAENQLFWDIDTRYWHRHSVKPGLTGLAQVRGFRGATEYMSDLSNRLQSDLEYVANWSLYGDIKIVIKTFGVLLHKNAY